MCWVFVGATAADLPAEFPGVAPPLTEAQAIQLATADDTRPPDEPAWYGLLSNIASWPAEMQITRGPHSAEDGGAVMPDYAALFDDPAAHRGELVVVEGRFAGRQRRQVVLREGPWGRALTEWGVVVDPKPGGGQERIVIVYLIDPDGRQAVPRRNQRVQILARFYKLWNDVDADGNPATYPVFVGRAAALIEPETVAASQIFRQLIVGAIIVLTAGMFGIRWWARRRRVAGRRPRVGERRRAESRPDAFDDEDGPPLPDDPAEALAALDGLPPSDAERGDT